MEKVIHAVQIVETDTGYRIEITGDKERLKQIFEHLPFGKGGPFGFSGFRGGPGGFRGGPWGFLRHGPWGFRGPWAGWGHHGCGHGPWGWGTEESGEEYSGQAPETV